MTVIEGHIGVSEIVFRLEVHAQVISDGMLFSGGAIRIGAEPNAGSA